MAAPKSTFDAKEMEEFKRVFASFDTDGDQFIDDKVRHGGLGERELGRRNELDRSASAPLSLSLTVLPPCSLHSILHLCWCVAHSICSSSPVP